ncbi:MAG: metal-dependent transcriptional regulator [Desulfurococcaceae archaeon]
MLFSKSRVEDYLTTIYRLEEAQGVAKITDISRELGVSSATVSKVIGNLEKKGLVVREKYHYVALTSTGKQLAEVIIRKHRIAELFLSSILGFNDYDAHYYAHYLEHLPDVIIERIYQLLGSPVMCPHGNPLPGLKNYHADERLITLSTAQPGALCTVKRLLGELRDVLEFARSGTVRVGTVITVVSSKPESIVVRIGEQDVKEVPLRVASLILVSCTPRT